MKKTLFVWILLLFFCQCLVAQDVNGKIISTHHNITVLKVWGSHQERGYAAGYLLAEKFTDAYENYIAWAFGPYLPYAKMLIQDPVHFYIDQEYIEEAQSFIQGVHAAGYGLELDFADVLVGNCFLDIQGVLAGLASMQTGCSSLMSWGDATLRTDLNGKSVITRHLDWDIVPILLRNQVMVIHIPSEQNEQPWLLIGFAGQISVMSGVNESGLAVMHQSMNDLVTPGAPARAYEPITFSMRRAIERYDLNGDGINNVQDIATALTANPLGFANNYIITGIAPSTSGGDEQIAIVAEVSNTIPYYSIRHNTYEDNIPGQNLYAANACISRNNALNFCERYNNIIEQMGDGTRMSSKRSWEMMKNYSILPERNLQFMQFIPELYSLKLAVHQMDGTIASNAHILRFNTKSLFKLPQNLKDGETGVMQEPLTSVADPSEVFIVFPNPAKDILHVSFMIKETGYITADIFNILGERIYSHRFLCEQGLTIRNLDISALQQGTYLIRLNIPGDMISAKFTVIR